MKAFKINIDGHTVWTGHITVTAGQAYDKACEIKIANPEKSVSLSSRSAKCFPRQITTYSAEANAKCNARALANQNV